MPKSTAQVKITSRGNRGNNSKKSMLCCFTGDAMIAYGYALNKLHQEEHFGLRRDVLVSPVQKRMSDSLLGNKILTTPARIMHCLAAKRNIAYFLFVLFSAY